MTTTAYIALGGNLGDREATLRAALEKIAAHPGLELIRASRFHETAPVGGPEGQPAYLNAAAKIETVLTPRELLEALQQIESDLGRDRTREERFGPRTCDLDILLYGPQQIDQPDLTIPHPRMDARKFVLQPLAELTGDKPLPNFGVTVGELLKRLEKRSIKKTEGP